eukprot:972349-Prorocentrum_minimum.AAC.1
MHLLGLPVGKHVLVYGKDANGKTVMRAYTPISTNTDLGVMKMLIKVYFKVSKNKPRSRRPKRPSTSKLSTLVNHSAHGISNIPSNIRRIFPAERLPLAGRQSTPGLEQEGPRLFFRLLFNPATPPSPVKSPLLPVKSHLPPVKSPLPS